eukprot:scaffold67431_cov19-Tisochrysis_lutea.AAC.1
MKLTPKEQQQEQQQPQQPEVRLSWLDAVQATGRGSGWSNISRSQVAHPLSSKVTHTRAHTFGKVASQHQHESWNSAVP